MVKRKREPQEVRKAALIEAAVNIIAAEGLNKLTSQKVAKEAGMTAAMVNFHFAGKTILLHETLKYVADSLINKLEEVANNHDGTPKDLIIDLIRAALSKDVSTTNKIAVWYAFYSDTSTRTDYLRICEKHNEIYCNIFRKPIEELCQKDPRQLNIDAVTMGLIGMIEYSCDQILTEPDYNSEDGIQEAIDLMKAIFPNW